MERKPLRNLSDVLLRVQDIRNALPDDERAHSMEDDLYADVLRAVVDSVAVGKRINAAELRRMAEAALATKGMKFHRWAG